MTKFSPLKEELRRAWRDLRGADLSPARGAAAVALGLFIGSQPIFGLHTPLVIGLCLWFRLDGAIAWIAANVSNPFFAPVLFTAWVQAGAYIRTGAPIRIDHEFKGWTSIYDFAGYAFVGAPIIGLMLAMTGGMLAFGFIAFKRHFWPASGKRQPYCLPAEAPAWFHAVERVAERYASSYAESPAQRAQFHYVRVKLLGDPVAKLVAEIDAKKVLGQLLDIGTGRGQLPILLLELGRAVAAKGIDWDVEKVEHARRAAGAQPDGRPPLPADFEQGDARRLELTGADTVLLIDILHYFELEEQNALLRRAAAAVRPGGRLLIREADTERGLRSTITLLEEKLFTLVRFNRGDRVRFRPARDIVALLAGLGFCCEILPAWGKTPFSNVLVVARRPIESAA